MGGAVAGALLVAVLVSPTLGRAEPTGNYRPDLPPDALATGCFPLPGGARLDLAHQIRRDGDVRTPRGLRRELHGQYDLVDRDDAERRIVTAFTAVGFRRTGPATSRGAVVLTDRTGTRVVVTVAAIPGTGAGTLVRGDFWLDLPSALPARSAEVCEKPSSTKRFPS